MRMLLQKRSWPRVDVVHEQPDADLADADLADADLADADLADADLADADLADALQNMEHDLLGIVNSMIDVLMRADQFKPTNAPTNIPR
jgi:uncharacterized protein YjbI with pentapeptide repeats